jgi:hypothetical protein
MKSTNRKGCGKLKKVLIIIGVVVAIAAGLAGAGLVIAKRAV